MAIGWHSLVASKIEYWYAPCQIVVKLLMSSICRWTLMIQCTHIFICNDCITFSLYHMNAHMVQLWLLCKLSCAHHTLYNVISRFQGIPCVFLCVPYVFSIMFFGDLQYLWITMSSAKTNLKFPKNVVTVFNWLWQVKSLKVNYRRTYFNKH